MKSKPKQNIIALVYDFDGTFSPNNHQEDTIFRAYGINKHRFWARANDLVRERGYERTLSYLKLLIHDAPFRKRPLARPLLRALADRIENFPGVEEDFGHIKSFLRSVPEVQ